MPKVVLSVKFQVCVIAYQTLQNYINGHIYENYYLFINKMCIIVDNVMLEIK
jgi:hypothetical protein